MSRVLCVTALMFVAVSALTSSGCGSKQEPAQPAASAPKKSADVDLPQSDIERALAKLPEEDRELAIAQKVCPVTGEPLGSMGAPIKVTVDGRHLFICCEGCEEDAKKNFDEYLAKLDKPSDAEVGK